VRFYNHEVHSRVCYTLSGNKCYCVATSRADFIHITKVGYVAPNVSQTQCRLGGADDRKARRIIGHSDVGTTHPTIVCFAAKRISQFAIPGGHWFNPFQQMYSCTYHQSRQPLNDQQCLSKVLLKSIDGCRRACRIEGRPPCDKITIS